MEKTTQSGASVHLTQYSSGDIIENEMGRARRAYGEDERRTQGFSGET